MPEENNGQPPSGEAQSKPLTQNPGVSFPEEGIVTKEGEQETSKSESDTDKLARKVEKEVHWVTHATFWSQIGLAPIGLVALWIYYNQLQQMIHATQATQDAAYDACVSAKIARRTLLEMQAGESDTHSMVAGAVAQAAATTHGEAAILTVNGPGFLKDAKPDTEWTLPIQIMNIGKSPAKNVYVRLTARLLKTDEEPHFNHLDGFLDDMRSGIIHPGNGEVGAAEVRDPDGELVKPNEQQVSDFLSGKLYIASFGRIEYSDMFGVRHWVAFCGYDDRLPRDPNKHERRHVKCAAYNNGDTNQFLTLPPEERSQIPTPIDDVVCTVPKH